MKDETFVKQWVAEGRDVFKQSFTLGKFDHHRIARSPDMELGHGSHRELTLDGLGRINIDTYAGKRPPLQMFARLYHVSTGQFAWYRIRESDSASPKSAVESPSAVLSSGTPE